MSHFSFYFLLLISFSSFAQKKWDGGGGNNLWNNALNWSGNTLPSTTDDILLDNSIVTASYTVLLPSTAVTVKTIVITPSSGRTIELTLPASNTAVPGLTINGPGYGLIINSGGTFRNSSGSSSGTTVKILDSIRINNDGRYVHNSASGHSTNVQVISTAPGTEMGIMELDIPSASSTISISGRTFGKFVLRSTAAGGTCNYTAAGTSRVNIRNTLDIGAGVNFNLNCSDTIAVGGDLLLEAGTFNLGNSTRSVVLSIQQNITQNTGGVITESGTGTQTILMNGSGFQLVTFRGTITNQVALVKDNSGVALFKAPVSIPYKLSLKSGRVITTQALITLQAGCVIEADTVSGNGFVEGPLKKDGLSNQPFLFPVGKSNAMRWLQLQNATGNFTVEYFSSDPHSISSSSGTGIHHFSKVEYWDVTSSGSAAAVVKLSFDDPLSGGVTNLSGLRVARLISGVWEDAGNAAFAGSPGADGWVSSNTAGGFSANTKSFALASAMGQENPLPLSTILLSAARSGSYIKLAWQVTPEMNIKKFVLERSYDGRNYTSIQSIDAIDGSTNYCHLIAPENISASYRVIAYSKDEMSEYTSCVAKIQCRDEEEFSISGSNVRGDVMVMSVTSVNGGKNVFIIYDSYGRVVGTMRHEMKSGSEKININISQLPAGLYFIKEITGKFKSGIVKFIKI